MWLACATAASGVVVALLVIAHFVSGIALLFGHGLLLMFAAGLSFEAYSAGKDIRAELESDVISWTEWLVISLWLGMVTTGYALGFLAWLRYAVA